VIRARFVPLPAVGLADLLNRVADGTRDLSIRGYLADPVPPFERACDPGRRSPSWRSWRPGSELCRIGPSALGDHWLEEQRAKYLRALPDVDVHLRGGLQAARRPSVLPAVLHGRRRRAARRAGREHPRQRQGQGQGHALRRLPGLRPPVRGHPGLPGRAPAAAVRRLRPAGKPASRPGSPARITACHDVAREPE
jgi:hypothetical protein